MNKQNRILVITPTLGESETLDETMASVVKYAARTTHVLSVPRSKVHSLQTRYPWARVVEDAGKEGAIYGALNRGIEAVPEGWDWFTYINDDDRLEPGFGEMARAHFERRSPEPVTYGDVELIDQWGASIGMVTTERSPRWIPALLKQGISPLMQQGMLFSRDTVRALRGFDTRYRLCADLDFWLRAYDMGHRFRNYAIRVASFRVRGGQLSGNTRLTIQEQEDIVARHLPEHVGRPIQRLALLRYRLANLPRYARRFRSRGIRTSYQLLEGEGAAA